MQLPLLDAILHLIYPEFCSQCGWIGSHLCQKCSLEVDFLLHPPQLDPDSSLDSLTIGFHYTPPISLLIQDMKFRSVKGICPLLGELLYYHTDYPDAEIVTSVPLIQENQKLRGFNQAREMAQTFARLAKRPYRELLTKTNKSTVHQASLVDRQARLKNIHTGTFLVIPDTSLPESVLLIDDVYTTGATLRACAETLKQNGVKTVHGLAVAHGS